MELTDAFELYLNACRAAGQSPHTLSWYRSWLGQFVVAFKGRRLSDITRQHARDYLLGLRSRNQRYGAHPYRAELEGRLSEFSINGHVRALRTFFTWLKDEGHIKPQDNPMLGIKLMPLPKRPPKSINLDDLRKLIRVTDGDSRNKRRDRAIVLFLADTGCRVGGLVNLTLADLDLDRKLALVFEKGSKSRFVPFTEMTRLALIRWLEVRPANQGQHVFLSFVHKRKLTYTGVHQMLTRLKLRAGINGRVNPHSFRHGFAREFILNGGSLATLADLMGHADIKTTKDYYAVYTTEELTRQHRKFSPITHLYNHK